MNTASQDGETTSLALQTILNKLQTIEAKLSDMEKAQKEPVTESTERLLGRLSLLTLKRHAVLTATIGGRSYKELSDIMKCSQTTVKLHLKAALQVLDIPDRDTLYLHHAQMLNVIPDGLYIQRFGISKRWWMEENPKLIEFLSSTKHTANQHTKHEEEDEDHASDRSLPPGQESA